MFGRSRYASTHSADIFNEMIAIRRHHKHQRRKTQSDGPEEKKYE